MTDQTTPETTEDDDFPPVHFALRNTTGEGGTIELRQPVLGLDLYLLITPGDEAINVEGSHVDMDGMVGALAVVLATALQAEQVSDTMREQAMWLVANVEDADA